MVDESTQPLKLFYCYVYADRALRDELDIYLSVLKHQNLIVCWSDMEISPGVERENAIDIQLSAAHLILLLVTPDFLASDYCYGIEMKRALERHKAGNARVIPIILRQTYWKQTPFSTLQVLPTNAKPIAQWHDRDEAFLNITSGIHQAIKELRAFLKTKEENG